MSDERRQQIVDAARQLYEEQGLSATTVKDISERCGVARSLFYHYFRNKQEVTSAVIDDFVNDYIESLQFWNEHRTPGDIEGSRKLQLDYLDLANALFTDVNPVPVKAAMELMGMGVGQCRLPLYQMDEQPLARLEQVLRRHGLIG